MNESELQHVVAQYESALQQGTLQFFDSLTLLDIYDYYHSHSQPLNAAACLHHALRLHPDNIYVLVTYANFLLDQGQPIQAIAVVDAIPQKDHPEVSLFWAESNLLQGKINEAEKFFEKARLTTDQDADQFSVEVAQFYLDYNLPTPALKWLRRVSPTSPQRLQTLQLMANAYSQLSNLPAAISCLNNAIDANPYDEHLWTDLATLYVALQRHNEALASADYALAINPNNPDALRLKIQTLSQLLRPDEAQNCATAIQNDQNTPPELLEVAAQLPLMAGKPVAAQTLLQQALRQTSPVDPRRPSLLWNLAIAHLLKNDVDQAVSLAIASAQSSQTVIPTLAQLAQLAAENNMHQEAIQIIRQIEQSPTFAVADAEQLAETLATLGLYEPCANVWQIIFQHENQFQAHLQPILNKAHARLA